jgi:hypothetical protein
MAVAKARPGDEKQLQRMAALVSAHSEMDISEALEAIGVAELKDQRRLRKQFEARRDELVGAVEERREQRASEQAQTAKVAALQLPKEPRVSSAPVALAAGSVEPSAGAAEPRPANAPRVADAPSSAAMLRPYAGIAGGAGVKSARGPAIGLPPCAMPGNAASVAPLVSGALEAAGTALRLQRAMIDAWLQLPPVALALRQQAAFYNFALSFAASTLPKAR